MSSQFGTGQEQQPLISVRPSDVDACYSLVFVGKSGVGKTELFNRIHPSVPFSGSYHATQEISSYGQRSYVQGHAGKGSRVVVVDYVDTPGALDKWSLTKNYIREADAIFLCVPYDALLEVDSDSDSDVDIESTSFYTDLLRLHSDYIDSAIDKRRTAPKIYLVFTGCKSILLGNSRSDIINNFVPKMLRNRLGIETANDIVFTSAKDDQVNVADEPNIYTMAIREYFVDRVAAELDQRAVTQAHKQAPQVAQIPPTRPSVTTTKASSRESGQPARLSLSPSTPKKSSNNGLHITSCGMFAAAMTGAVAGLATGIAYSVVENLVGQVMVGVVGGFCVAGMLSLLLLYCLAIHCYQCCRPTSNSTAIPPVPI
jgi:hypothetical protein